MKTSFARLAPLGALLLLPACSSSSSTASSADAGRISFADAGSQDSGGSQKDGGSTHAPDAGSGTADTASGTPDTGSSTPDSSSGTADTGSGTPDAASGPPDAGSGTPDAGSSNPASVSVTGTFTVSCSQPLGGQAAQETDCVLTIVSVQSTPSITGALSSAVSVQAENSTSPDIGWSSGLDVTAPIYPVSCLQSLQSYSDGTWGFNVYGVTGGASCGLTSNPAPADFSSGFEANVPATWTATGQSVPLFLSLTLAI